VKRESLSGEKIVVTEAHLLLVVRGFNMWPSGTVLLIQRTYQQPRL